MGTLGVTEPDLSYRLLRAVSQTLQHGLPPEHLHVHHVRAHAGDPYNELVDYAAKQESQRSFNLPRMSINVQDCLDLGHVRDDHSAVGLQSAWNTVTQLSVPPKRKTQVHWRDQKIRESLHKIIQTIPHCAWQTDLETQAHDLARHLHNAMTNIAHPDIEAKKPYITHEIWQLRAHKLRLKKRLKDATEGTAVHLLKAAFGFWKSPSSDDAQNLQTFFDYNTTVHCRRIRLFAAVHIKSVQLRRQLQTAKQRHFDERLQQLDSSTPAASILRCLRDYVGPTNLNNFKKKVVPLVHNENGEPCQLPEEAMSDFGEFLQRNGADCLPGELLHYYPSELAALAPWKFMLHGHEDLSYKGGILVLRPTSAAEPRTPVRLSDRCWKLSGQPV